MTEQEIKKEMRKIKSKITRMMNIFDTACGDFDQIKKAMDLQFKIYEDIENLIRDSSEKPH